nr:chaperone protein DnaJ 49-like [Tanacetum cinerariifolium]
MLQVVMPERVPLEGVRRKKDYYDILGVSKDCGVEDIRKAYLKLSLKVHPDKNKAPGSEEAFKNMSKAYECLSDAESRKKYNVMGSEEPMSYMPLARRRASQNGFSYEGDIDAEEVCKNFFFGGMNPRATTQFSGFIFCNGTRARTQTQMGNTNNGVTAMKSKSTHVQSFLEAGIQPPMPNCDMLKKFQEGLVS